MNGRSFGTLRRSARRQSFPIESNAQNSQKVRPGHYLTCTSFIQMEQREYWDVSFADKVNQRSSFLSMKETDHEST